MAAVAAALTRLMLGVAAAAARLLRAGALPQQPRRSALVVAVAYQTRLAAVVGIPNTPLSSSAAAARVDMRLTVERVPSALAAAAVQVVARRLVVLQVPSCCRMAEPVARVEALVRVVPASQAAEVPLTRSARLAALAGLASSVAVAGEAKAITLAALAARAAYTRHQQAARAAAEAAVAVAALVSLLRDQTAATVQAATAA